MPGQRACPTVPHTGHPHSCVSKRGASAWTGQPAVSQGWAGVPAQVRAPNRTLAACCMALMACMRAAQSAENCRISWLQRWMAAAARRSCHGWGWRAGASKWWAGPCACASLAQPKVAPSLPASTPRSVLMRHASCASIMRHVPLCAHPPAHHSPETRAAGRLGWRTLE